MEVRLDKESAKVCLGDAFVYGFSKGHSRLRLKCWCSLAVSCCFYVNFSEGQP